MIAEVICHPDVCWRPRYAALMVAVAAYFVSVGMTVPTVPRYIISLGGGSLAVGLAVAVFSAAALAARPVVGRSLAVSAPKLLAVGCLVSAVTTLALLVANSPFLVALARAGGGVGEAFFFVIATAVVYRTVPADLAPRAQAATSTLVYVGILGGAATGEALRSASGFRTTWWAAAALALVGALASSATTPTQVAASRARGMLTSRAAIRPGLILAASTVAAVAFSSFLPLFARSFGVRDLTGVYVLFALVVVASRLAIILSPKAASVPSSSALGLCAAALIAAAGGSYPLLLVASLLGGLGLALAYPTLLATAVGAAAAPERPRTISTLTGFYDAGFLVAPLGFGGVAALAGYRFAYVAAASVCACAAFVAMRLQ